MSILNRNLTKAENAFDDAVYANMRRSTPTTRNALANARQDRDLARSFVKGAR